MRNRVVITGMGVVSSAGSGCTVFGESIVSAKQSFSPIDRPHLSHLRATHAGIVKGFDEKATEAYARSSILDKYVYFAETAAREALSESRIIPGEFGHRIGMVFATCSGPMQSIERHYARILSGDESLTYEQLFAKRYYSAAAALAHVFGIAGVTTTVVTACSASCAAIGIGTDLIRLGVADVVLAGGSDTFSESTLAGFDGLKATCGGLCAPFSKPSGLNLGEGAAFVVLEALTHAQNRGVSPHAEILGFGLSNDAYHCTAPEPSGAGQVLAMERALRDAGIAPAEITYVNAHGTGTDANDKTETRAIKKVFKETAARIPISSTKSMIGHCLGAAGALETVAGIVCLRKGIYPPTAHFSEAREGCNLDYIPDAGRKISAAGPFLKNNFAFGGNNASLALSPEIPQSRSLPQNFSTEEIVITGVGIVSAAGIGYERLCKAVDSQERCFSKHSVDQGRVCDVGMVPDFDMRGVDKRLDDRGMDRSSRFATVATKLALSHAAFPEKQAVRRDLGLFLHLSAGPSWAEGEHIGSLVRQRFHLSQVNAFPYIVPNSIAGIVCKSLNISGHNTTLCFGPGSGLMGLGFAANAIGNGHTKAVVSLSVDELSQRIMRDLLNAGLMTDAGQLYGEGACAIMLETESHARLRGAKIIGRLCSTAYSTETARLLEPDADTEILEKTVERALRQAGISAADIGCVCYSVSRSRESSAVDSVLKHSDYRSIDCGPAIGFAEATQPMYNLAYALLGSSFEKGTSPKYILVVFGSGFGSNCVTILRKESTYDGSNAGGN